MAMDWTHVYGHVCHTFQGLEHIRWVPLDTALGLAVLLAIVTLIAGIAIGYWLQARRLKDAHERMKANILSYADRYERLKGIQ